MHEEINLLSSARERKKGGKTVSRLRNFAVGFLLLVGISSMIIFILIYFSPLPSLLREKDGAIADLRRYDNEFVSLVVTRDRIKLAETILNSRKRFDEIFATVQNILPESTSITGYDITTKNASFTIVALSLVPLDEILQSLEDTISSEQYFRSLTISSLVYDGNRNIYELTVSLSLL